MSFCINKYLHVKFSTTHNKIIPLGDTGVELIRPDDWLHKDDEGKQTFQENFNYLETKPQICDVINSNPDYPYKVGQKLFVHYMAWETAQYGDILTNEGYILADYVFMVIEDDRTFTLTDDNYLGEQVVTPEVVRPSGIIVDLGGKKEALQVKITHIPKDSKVNIGDTVVSIDQYNYAFKLDGKEYVRLMSHEIVGSVIAA